MATPPGTACPFCQPARERIVFENPLVIALWDAFPVNRGHALIIPRRHVAIGFRHVDIFPWPDVFSAPSQRPLVDSDPESTVVAQEEINRGASPLIDRDPAAWIIQA